MGDNSRLRIGDLLSLLLILLIALVLSPIWLPFLAFAFVKDRLEQWRFARYLARNEGAGFFCYTSRQTSLEYVRTNILPHLSGDVEIIYMSEKGTVNLGDETEFAYRIAWQMKTVPGGFPYVSKVVDGKLVTESINNRLYSAITRKADSDHIVSRILKFFAR